VEKEQRIFITLLLAYRPSLSSL